MRQRCYQNQNQAKPNWIRISFRHWQFYSYQNILLQIFWTGICLSRKYLMVSGNLEGEQKTPCEDLHDDIVSVVKPCSSISLAVFFVQSQNISYGSEWFFPLCHTGGRERKSSKISWPDFPFWFHLLISQTAVIPPQWARSELVSKYLFRTPWGWQKGKTGDVLKHCPRHIQQLLKRIHFHANCISSAN